MSIVYDDKLDVWGREGTHDFKSAKEVHSLIKWLMPTPKDLVLDVGAHIGAFTRLCLQAGASVVAVEPEQDNLEVLQTNVLEFGDRCAIWPYAVTDDDEVLTESTVTLWKNVRGTHTGLHTLAYVRGRDPVKVTTMRFRDVLEQVGPSVLKIDIEGGEWALDLTNIPKCVTRLHVEMHMIPKSWGGREKAPMLHQELLSQGFTCVKQPNFKTMWGTHPIYHRSS